MANAFIGLDLGATTVKAVAFDRNDNVMSSASTSTPVRRLAERVEYEADDLWLAAATVLRAVTDELRPAGHHPVAVAVASMGEVGVLVNGRGRPLLPVIAGRDHRSAPQAAWWREHIGVQRTQRITCVAPGPGFGATRMLWARDNAPTAWSAGHRWLNMADWIAFRLTGRMATDHSLASRTMLYDLIERRWSRELIEAAGLEPSLLAPLIDSGEQIGEVERDAAGITGLPEGAVVGAGGHNHACAALALGVTEPGTMLDSADPVDAFFLVTRSVDASGVLAEAGIEQGAHVARGRTYAMDGHDDGVETDPAGAGSGATFDAMAAAGRARIRTLPSGPGRSDPWRVSSRSPVGSMTVWEDIVLAGPGDGNGSKPVPLAAVADAAVLGAAHLARRAVWSGSLALRRPRPARGARRSIPSGPAAARALRRSPVVGPSRSGRVDRGPGLGPGRSPA